MIFHKLFMSFFKTFMLFHHSFNAASGIVFKHVLFCVNLDFFHFISHFGLLF